MATGASNPTRAAGQGSRAAALCPFKGDEEKADVFLPLRILTDLTGRG